MTAIPFPIETHEPLARPLPRHWPAVAASAWIAAMFMLATNDLDAVSQFSEFGKERLLQLSTLVEGGRSTRQVAFVLLGGWGLLATLWPLPRRRPVRFTMPLLVPLVTLLVWAALSIAWSADLSFTAKRLTVLGCVALAIAGFVRRFALRDVATLALVGGSMQLAGDVIADALWHVVPYTDSEYRLSGLQHPNHAGITAAFVLMGVACAWDRTRRRSLLGLGAAVCAILLATKSRSSIIACAAGLAVFASLRLDARRLIGAAIAGTLAILATLALSAAGALPESLDSFVAMGRSDAGNVALTGRPMIWAAALEVAGSDATRLLTGAGYDSFWTSATSEFVSSRIHFAVAEGHSAYFDMLLELGVIGAILYAACLLVGVGRWAWLARSRGRATFAFAAAVCTFAIVHGFTESTMSDPTFGSTIVFATLASLAFRAPRPATHLEPA